MLPSAIDTRREPVTGAGSTVRNKIIKYNQMKVANSFLMTRIRRRNTFRSYHNPGGMVFVSEVAFIVTCWIKIVLLQTNEIDASREPVP